MQITATRASIADSAPFGGGLQRTTFTGGVDSTDPRNGKLTPIIATAPKFFPAAGIALLHGRDFADNDDANGAMVPDALAARNLVGVPIDAPVSG